MKLGWNLSILNLKSKMGLFITFLLMARLCKIEHNSIFKIKRLKSYKFIKEFERLIKKCQVLEYSCGCKHRLKHTQS